MLQERERQHLEMSGTSYRVDETYIKVRQSCKYLYRVVGKEENTIEFMLSAKRDVSAAKRFSKTMMRAEHRRLPSSIDVNKVNMMRKRQVKRLVGSDARGQATFVALLFGIAA